MNWKNVCRYCNSFFGCKLGTFLLGQIVWTKFQKGFIFAGEISDGYCELTQIIVGVLTFKLCPSGRIFQGKIWKI